MAPFLRKENKHLQKCIKTRMNMSILRIMKKQILI